MRDPAFLSQKATPATQADLSVAEDLLETLEAQKDGCVGMAANMIGVNKRIIALTTRAAIWFNPVIACGKASRDRPRYQCPEYCATL